MRFARLEQIRTNGKLAKIKKPSRYAFMDYYDELLKGIIEGFRKERQKMLAVSREVEADKKK